MLPHEAVHMAGLGALVSLLVAMLPIGVAAVALTWRLLLDEERCVRTPLTVPLSGGAYADS